MAAHVVPLGRWARSILAVSIPLALAFLLLSVLGLLPPVAAVITWAGLSLIAAVFLRIVLAELGALTRHVEASSSGTSPSGAITRRRGS